MCGMAGRAHRLPEPRVEIEIMELAYASRSDAASLRGAVPYISREHASSVASPLALPSSDARRIGILWAASDWDTERSIPGELLPLLMGGLGAAFYSFQQGVAESEWSAQRPRLYDISEKTRDIADLAGAMLQMDLIVTVDGMAAHLAGALGRPVWVLLKAGCDWRWQASGSESPWYPSARLFRQEPGSGWSAVLQEVNAALRNWEHSSLK